MTTTADPHVQDQAPEPFLEEVSDGIFGYVQPDGSWGLNNTGFLVGEDGVLVVDTCFTEERTRQFLDAIRKVTDRPARTLVNTHHHGDHTHGNYMLPSATIIAHERCRQVMIDFGHATMPLFPGVEWGDVKIAPPFVTFEDRLNLYVDDLRVEAIYVGPAHTTNDVVYWVPDRKLLFAGDLVFNQGTPFVVMGSVDGSLAALQRIKDLGAETIVPGHGDVCGPEIYDDMAAYLKLVRDDGDRAYDAGLSPLDAAREIDLGRFAAWHDAERIVGNLHRRYSERRGEPTATPLDVQTVWQDMLTYNGGKPLRCLA